MYSRVVDGQVLEFGVSGKLIMNVLVMYDRQSNSLWSQLLGKAVQGPFVGSELEYFPARLTTWADWKTHHPNSLALVKGYSGLRDPYARYYVSGQTGVLGETRLDSRLPSKQFVVGVAHGDDSVAFPFSVLNDNPVVNEVVGEVPILVVFDGSNASGVVFSRQVGERTLSFQSHSALELVDEQTGTVWDGMSGLAISGQLSGTQLERVKSTTSFWFGWKDFYPNTRVHGVEG